MDSALVFESKGCGFESRQGCLSSLFAPRHNREATKEQLRKGRSDESRFSQFFCTNKQTSTAKHSVQKGAAARRTAAFVLQHSRRHEPQLIVRAARQHPTRHVPCIQKTSSSGIAYVAAAHA